LQVFNELPRSRPGGCCSPVTNAPGLRRRSLSGLRGGGASPLSGRFGAQHPLLPGSQLGEGCRALGLVHGAPQESPREHPHLPLLPGTGGRGLAAARGAAGFAVGFGVLGHSPPKGAVPICPPPGPRLCPSPEAPQPTGCPAELRVLPVNNFRLLTSCQRAGGLQF